VSVPEPRTVREMVELGRAFLAKKGVEPARREAELVVAHALGLDRLGLFLVLERPLQREEVVRGRELLTRRGKREPTAYLTGQREFYGRDFRVGPGVLVPRPETELLVDRARVHAGPRRGLTCYDLGTGSGCLAVTLALELDEAQVTASDLSARALEYARDNAARLGAKVEFLEGDGPAPVAGRRFDLVVSNPPYIDPAVRAALAPEVAGHEPAEALFAPAGSPDHWAMLLARAAPTLLAPGGVLLLELGHDQAARLRPALASLGLPLAFTRDLERHERVLELGPL